jgi:hypothetical protein
MLKYDRLRYNTRVTWSDFYPIMENCELICPECCLFLDILSLFANNTGECDQRGQKESIDHLQVFQERDGGSVKAVYGAGNS